VPNVQRYLKSARSEHPDSRPLSGSRRTKIFASRRRWSGVRTLAQRSKGDFRVLVDECGAASVRPSVSRACRPAGRETLLPYSLIAVAAFGSVQVDPLEA
jgi:hypothetical protein